MSRTARLTALPILLLALRAAPAAAQSSDRWYAVSIGGAHVGWSHESRAAIDSGIAVSTTLHIVINRLGHAVVIETVDRSVETVAGAFVSSETTTRLSEQATVTHAWLDGDSVRISTTAGGRTFSRAVAAGGALIGAAAAMRLTADTLRAPGDSVVFRTFLATLAAPATVTRTLAATDTITVAGRTLEARRVLERSAALPVAARTWIDAAGRLLTTAFDSPLGTMVSVLADSASAVPASAVAVLGDDQFSRTLVRTHLRIPQARRLAMLRLALRADSSLPWPDLEGPGQHVRSAAPGTLVLQITRRDPPAGSHPFPVAVTAETREFLAPNAYVQSDDSTLRALALRIVGPETDAWRATLALEHWVADSMHFDLGIAFAPSVEILQRRRGTCVAYATMLASLARALGIPSRVAFGYVYVNGIFGGHAWTEVRIGDGWYAADGAVVPYGAADAARLAFATGSLANGAADLTGAPGARLYNGLRARVLAYRVAGEPAVTVDTAAEPWTAAGDRYRNAALGVAFSKPAGYRWIELDDTWPSMAIAGATDAAGDTVRVLSEMRAPWEATEADAKQRAAAVNDRSAAALRIAGRAAWTAAGTGHALAALPFGSETLVIEGVGPAAAGLVRAVAESLRLAPGAADATGAPPRRAPPPGASR